MSQRNIEKGTAPPGWYPDPEVAGYLRRWDGRAGVDHRVKAEREAAPPAGPGARPQAGWYPDPAEDGHWRGWDGTAWTEERRKGTVAKPGRSDDEADRMWQKAFTTAFRSGSGGLP